MVRGESESRGRISRERDGDERGRELSPSNPGRVRAAAFSLLGQWLSHHFPPLLDLYLYIQVTHTGRGGAGNIRSPSREPGAIREEILHERQVIDASKDPKEQVTFVRIFRECNVMLCHPRSAYPIFFLFIHFARERGKKEADSQAPVFLSLFFLFILSVRDPFDRPSGHRHLGNPNTFAQCRSQCSTHPSITGNASFIILSSSFSLLGSRI